jgi:hypothetical protein
MTKKRQLARASTKLKQYDFNQPNSLIEMAKSLKKHIVQNNLYTPITIFDKKTGKTNTKNYVHVDGWQFAGGLLGMVPKVVEIKDLSNENKTKWQAEVEIIKLETEKIIGRGFAICDNKEKGKTGFDEYAVLSMAQTRATGKAFRNSIGWIIKLAGYETTPAEEMKEEKEKIKTAKPVAKRTVKSVQSKINKLKK